MDILRDNLGDARVDWPHAMFMVAGTQAESPKANSIALMRVTSISKTYKAPKVGSQYHAAPPHTH
jgi:hypothetical protein